MSIIARAKELLAMKPVFLDTETTGLGPLDQIVELAIVDTDGSVLLDTLVKPTIRIPSVAEAIHGISNDDIAGAPSFAAVLPELQKAIGSRPLVIYNADYDLRLIRQSAKAHRLTANLARNAHCAMKMYAEFRGVWDDFRREYRWHKLDVAAIQCGIDLDHQAHRARSDADLARRVTMTIAGIAC